MELIKEKAIFVLRGGGSSGKTETLLRLCHLLSVISDTFAIERYSEWTHDCYGAFYFGNKAVCVGTAGDNKGEIEGNIEFFRKKKASVIFTAVQIKSGRNNNFDKQLYDFAQSKKYQIVNLEKKDYKTNAEAAYELFKKSFLQEE
ncbi:hypothetical protein [Treponema sp.]|uniref:hypothetical protein n=1 Tax=Treponema sp. TaxID=166 RepID=UPI00298E3CE7|nr:hypothetical protein [Treponema sp.]MCR5614502.1 hypothetical protein [Treponema sp.]